MKYWKVKAIKAIKAGTIKTTIGDTIRDKSLDVKKGIWIEEIL